MGIDSNILGSGVELQWGRPSSNEMNPQNSDIEPKGLCNCSVDFVPTMVGLVGQIVAIFGRRARQTIPIHIATSRPYFVHREWRKRGKDI